MTPLIKLAALWGSGAVVLTAAGTFVVFDLVGDQGGATAAAPSDSTGGGSAAAGDKDPGAGGNGNGPGGQTGAGNPGHPITVTGIVAGTIRLGSPTVITVSIANRNNQDIVVNAVTATVTSATGGRGGNPACSASWFSAGSFNGSKLIRKNQTGSVTLPFVLMDEPAINQDACQGARVNLTYRAQARQA